MQPELQQARSLWGILILLTALMIFAQVLFLGANVLTSEVIDSVLSVSITRSLLSSPIVLFALGRWVLGQCILYAFYIISINYISCSIGELFHLRNHSVYRLGITLWLISTVAVISANLYFVPHSFFSILIQDYIGSHTGMILFVSTGLLVIAAFLTLINLIKSIYLKRHLFRHGVAVICVLSIACLTLLPLIYTYPKQTVSSASHPNIIIIGVDALRPDFVGFYGAKTKTPTMDDFLKTSIHFSNAYTPLARTFPSWTSILTGTYPLHNGARGNNTFLNNIQLAHTLPKTLQQLGYQTIYSTDDTRFNNTNAQYGFDHVITPPMGINDFLIGSLNDFPLSNLIIPTPLGRLLFPYNYSNHGTPLNYSPANYLLLLQQALHQRDDKPLFLAVHFTLTHWPFYWFNDQQSLLNQHEYIRYQHSIEATDKQLNQFFNMLRTQHLLDHAIVVLLSDHGITLGLHHDKVISADHYQGHPINIKKIPVSKYADAPSDSLDFTHDFGIDTSYGYGSDVLSLKAYHTLLAIKSYGITLGPAHEVDQPVALIDITPTLLDLLHTSHFKTDGKSLKNYLKNNLTRDPHRALFLETSFSMDEIEKEDISIKKVLQKALPLYQLDQTNGLVYIEPRAEMAMNQNKQLAILQNNWLLLRFPSSRRTKLDLRHQRLESYFMPAFMVLVDLKTGAWTTELNSHFAHTAPVNALQTALFKFYRIDNSQRSRHISPL